MKLNSVDLDHDNLNLCKLICERISSCSSCIRLKYRKSASGRGYHIKFFCSEDCEQCRSLYDDLFRFHADLKNRTEDERNVLFSTKHYKDHEGNIIKRHAGEWVKVK